MPERKVLIIGCHCYSQIPLLYAGERGTNDEAFSPVFMRLLWSCFPDNDRKNRINGVFGQTLNNTTLEMFVTIQVEQQPGVNGGVKKFEFHSYKLFCVKQIVISRYSAMILKKL